MSDTELTLRPFETMVEYQACVDFQEEVWGVGFREQVSTAILMIANKLGGLAAGAFDAEGRMHGFVFGMTGLMEGRLVHWSDMLAVRADRRDGGLGTRLKCYQREVLLSRGVNVMHWTFDPLQGRNAHVNFAKLGILTREYVPDMYGETESPLHRVGTDRLVARWEMDSARVERRLSGEGAPPDLGEMMEEGSALRLLSWRMQGDFPEPGPADLTLAAPLLLLTVPGDIDAMMEADLELAIRWREATRAPFLHYLGLGYEVRELFRDGPVNHYLLGREEHA